MYLSYYSLSHKPFQISTDPDFLWLGEKHMEALSTLRYGVLDNKGFLLLTGDVGTGKTTLINALLKTLGANVLVATIRDPDLKPSDFFQYTAYVFGVKKEITSKSSFLIHFEQFLNHAYEHEKKVLLIIDEAQRINQRLLEEVRLLSNIEKNERKLLNIFFVGQVEFNDILLRPANRPIRQRITINYNIETLSAEETELYIKHRLAIASRNTNIKPPGSHGKTAPESVVQKKQFSPFELNSTLFTDEAIREVHLFSKGYPRLINIICDRSLLTSYVEESKKVLAHHVQECAKELEIPYFGTTRYYKKKDLQNPSFQDSTFPQDSQKKRQKEAVGKQPITELAIHNENSNNNTVDSRKKKSSLPPDNDKKGGKFLKGMGIGASVMILVVICYFSIFRDSGFSTHITATLKDSSILKNAAGIWQSLGIQGFAKKFGIENTTIESDPDESDSTGKSMQKNPLFQDEKKTAASPASAPGSPTQSKLLGKLIMPFPEEATLPPPTSLANLNMLIESISLRKPYKIIITGFTDAKEDEKKNLEASTMKANAVKIYLISRGLEEKRMEIRGLGSEFPIASNITTTGRKDNHRVEVEFRGL